MKLLRLEKEAIIEALKRGDIKISGHKDCGVSICKLCSGINKIKNRGE